MPSSFLFFISCSTHLFSTPDLPRHPAPTRKKSDTPVSFSDIEEWWKRKHLLRHVMRGASDGPMETNEGGETARRQCFFFVSPSRKFPRLPHDTIPNAETATVARRPPARVICRLALVGQDVDNYTPLPCPKASRDFGKFKILRIPAPRKFRLPRQGPRRRRGTRGQGGGVRPCRRQRARRPLSQGRRRYARARRR